MKKKENSKIFLLGYNREKRNRKYLYKLSFNHYLKKKLGLTLDVS